MSRLSLRLVWLLLPVCLALFVLGLRWGIADRYGMALPNWDQWDAEEVHLLVPWSQGRLTWAELVYPHNEHRVVVTKLVNLGLTAANGQWDQRVEIAVNSLVPALLAAALFCAGRRQVGPVWQAPLFCLLALLYALPLAWENFLNGFHSAQQFLVVFSFLAIALLPFHRPSSPKWWLGAISLALAMGSMASGFLTALIVAPLAALRWRAGASNARAAAPTFLVCALAVAAGFLTRVTVAGHDPLRAHSASDFIFTIVRALGWPTFESPLGWLALLLWLPWLWLGIRLAEDRQIRAERFPPMLFGLGGWVGLQILATAYARGDGGPAPASRYVDTLVAGMAVNGLALAWLLQHRAALGPAARRGLVAAGVAWALLLASGAAMQVDEIWSHELGAARLNFYYCEQNVRHFLVTGDRAFLAHDEIPYPSAAVLLERLALPEIRRILPSTVRLPLPLAAAPGAAGFVQADNRHPQSAPPVPGNPPAGLSPRAPPLDQAVTWGSYSAAGPTAAGPWRSLPLRATLRGWLWFIVAGDADSPGSELALRDPDTGRLLAQLRPDRHPGDTWRSAYVRAPAGPFVVTAQEKDPGRWLAFSQPVEVGELSYRSWRAMKQGFFLAELAAGSAALLGLLAAASAVWRPR